MRQKDIQLPKAFLEKFPAMKQEKMNMLHDKYLNTCRHFLYKILPHIHDDVFHFPLKKAQDMCGDFIYKGNRYYVWHEFFNIQPFFYISKIGTNFHGMTSQVKILNQKYIDLLIDTADTKLLVETYYHDVDINSCLLVKIDYNSLVAYISQTEHLLTTINDSDNRYPKLLQNLRTAKYFKIISEYFYDQYDSYVIPHVKSDKTEYGRTYYKGINLQNCSKEVRDASLGDHTSYDLNAAAYAIKLLLVKDIYNVYNYDFNGAFTYTKDYLDHKSQIRNELASLIYQHMPNYPNPLKLVKEAMNAIGFGAKIHEGSWEIDGVKQYSALHDIIYNKNARIAFTKHDFVINFLKEQDQLGKIIYEYFSRNIEFVEKVKNVPNIYANNGKLNKSKVLAYLYQHAETMIMDMITENVNCLLRVHDSFIVDKPLQSEKLKDIKLTLKTISPYLTLSTDNHNGWIHQEVLSYEYEHRQFIKQEELLVNNGKMPKKFKKPYISDYHQTDYSYYDGYDDGSQYDYYNNDHDDMIKDMSSNQRLEHYRIVGHVVNKLPEHVNKLLRK